MHSFRETFATPDSCAINLAAANNRLAAWAGP